MFELLSLIGIALIAATVVERFSTTQSKKESPEDSPMPETKRLETHLVEQKTEARSIGADGTLQVPRDARFSFVSSFGVRPEQLKELHIYSVAGSLEQFPAKVADLLRKLYDSGYAVGEEIMAVIHHGRPLKEGEAIYVAVAQDERLNKTRTVAFLDRRRAC